MLDRDQALSETGEAPRWAREAVRELESTITSKSPRFPCLYALRALNRGTLRYALVPGMDGPGLDSLAAALREYVAAARDLGDISSLLAVFPPDESPAALDDHEARFWHVLEALHERDDAPWPGEIPTDPERHLWEFCFGGEALFVFGSSPAYLNRKSRQTRTFTMAFQPRFMFDRLFATPVPLAGAMRMIRQRLETFDGIAIHPDLGLYPEAGNREWRQYMIPDSNEPNAGTCPLRFGEAGGPG